MCSDDNVSLKHFWSCSTNLSVLLRWHYSLLFFSWRPKFLDSFTDSFRFFIQKFSSDLGSFLNTCSGVLGDTIFFISSMMVQCSFVALDKPSLIPFNLYLTPVRFHTYHQLDTCKGRTSFLNHLHRWIIIRFFCFDFDLLFWHHEISNLWIFLRWNRVSHIARSKSRHKSTIIFSNILLSPNIH